MPARHELCAAPAQPSKPQKQALTLQKVTKRTTPNTAPAEFRGASCSFSQIDIDDVRMWMVHAMDEDGRKLKRYLRRERCEPLSHSIASMGFQPQVVNTHTSRREPQTTLNHSPQGNSSLLKRKYMSVYPESDARSSSRQKVGDYVTKAEDARGEHLQTSTTPSDYYNSWNKRREDANSHKRGRRTRFRPNQACGHGNTSSMTFQRLNHLDLRRIPSIQRWKAHIHLLRQQMTPISTVKNVMPQSPHKQRSSNKRSPGYRLKKNRTRL
jgi:hypothetical protein